MNLFEDDDIFNAISSDKKEILSYISAVVENIANAMEITILKKTLCINSDDEDWWYSYTFILDCNKNLTDKLNNSFLDVLVSKEYTLDLENKIITRLETGANDGY